MRKERNYYKLYSKFGLEGYYIPVRNTFSNNIEREFIPMGAKDLYQEKFGDKDYETIKRIRGWLDKHPKRSSLLAYLLDDSPYSG